MQEKSKIVDFNKNQLNIISNRQYRNKKKNFTMMLSNPLFHLLKKLQKMGSMGYQLITTIEREEVQEKCKNIGFDKNLKNITDSPQHRKKKNKFYSDVVKSVVSSIEEALESGKTVV